MNVLIVGSGYVGLVQAACFAEFGHKVTCLDKDIKKISLLKNSEIPFYEPGLKNLVEKQINKNLFFSNNIQKSISEASIIFIAVGTPCLKDGSVNLKYIKNVATEIGQYVESKDFIVVNKSTVPVGTTELVKKTILRQVKKRKFKTSFNVISNPEFLKEGSAVNDCLNPDRIVIGSSSLEAAKIIAKLHKTKKLEKMNILYMNPRSAELSKYAANAMLASRISFINEMSILSDKLDADINDIKDVLGSDPRIGNQFLNPGCGYGGSCFPKDVKALIKQGKDNGIDLKISKATESANNRQKEIVFKQVNTHFKNKLKNKNLAIWGLSFKPGTDDIREATSISLIPKFLAEGSKIQAFDPEAMNNIRNMFPDEKSITFFEDKYDAVRNSDALIILTEWPIFVKSNLKKVRELLKTPIIFDGRNIFDKKDLINMGINYYSIGRGDIKVK